MSNLRDNRSPLTPDEVRLILRIYWTDRITRRHQGNVRGTPGIRNRLSKQFGVSYEVIKKLVGIKHNQYGRKRRDYYPYVALKMIQLNVKNKLRKKGIIP